MALAGALLIAGVPALRLTTADATLGVIQSFGGANNAVGSSMSVFPNAPTASGDLLVAAVKNRDLGGYETVASVTDSAGNTWTAANRLSQGRQADEEIWYAGDAASIGANGSVTVTMSGAAAIAVTVLEVAGASPTPLDDVASAGDNSTSAATGAVPAVTQDIVIADVGWNADVTPGGQTPSFTTTAVEQSTVEGGMTGEQAAWDVVSNQGTQSYSTTLSAPVVWTATIVTFDAAVDTSPTPTPSATATPTPTTRRPPRRHRP